jgi:catechol 2,3-dioxygenase-like lactoylglutathione lyase family enzyme
MTNPKPNQTPSQTLGLNTLNHFGVGVSNLERSIEFYQALTGEPPVDTGTWESTGLGMATGAGQNAKIHWATVRLANVNIDLIQVLEPKDPAAEYKMNQPGAIHVCFEVEDLAAVFDRMENAGIEFLGPWHRVSAQEDGAEKGMGTAVAYFNGPDGELLEIIQPEGPFVRKQAAQSAVLR